MLHCQEWSWFESTPSSFPEFIPVLKALDVQKLSPLPFEDGALINLSKRSPSPAGNGEISDQEDDE